MNKPLTEKQIDNRYEKRELLKAQIAALEAQIDAIDDEMKAECVRLGVEYLNGKKSRVRFAFVIKPQFQAAKFKKDHPELAAGYTKETTSRPFYFEQIPAAQQAEKRTEAKMAAATTPATVAPIPAAVAV